MKRVLLLCLIFFGLCLQAQTDKNFRVKEFKVTQDSIFIDSISINPQHFKVLTATNTQIDSSAYKIDFAKALLVLDHLKYPEIVVEYYAYPEFLTKTYFKFNRDIIIENPTADSPTYSFNSANKKPLFQPFDGLNTSGSLSRGLTVGNNQDAVLNSSLDLQIAGKLSEKVTLRASITDSNIPFQENGYTQQLNEFDRVYIELFSDYWSIRAGDVNLENTGTHYANFRKKIAGIAVDGTINHPDSKTKVFASGALVRGKFATYNFVGTDGNQGPYRVYGPNNEQYIIIVSGTETVYVNGQALTRGENKDYIIDYNTAEITFMPTFPITANMRVFVEFQYSDQNYTRFVTHNGANYESDKFSIGGSIFSENDAKNQPIQQDLTDEQKQILADAGNDTSKMVAPSAVPAVYDENKIQYRKDIIGTEEVFVFSNEPTDVLYDVRFTNFGSGQGDYILKETIAIGKVFEYIGVNLGSYNPEVQLIAPNKIQMAVINSSFTPTEKTNVYGEVAFSKNDLNLFSDIDNETNDGLASKINWNQTIIDSDWDLKSILNFETVSENFKSIQLFRNVEFNRDWNLIDPIGDQRFINANLKLENNEKGFVGYNFEQLVYDGSFDGNKHQLIADMNLKNFNLFLNSSVMNSESLTQENYFFRLYGNAKYNFNKSWIGAKVNTEHNELKDIPTKQLSILSQQFKEYEGYFGIGDSTKVFAEIGYNFRTNDSLKLNALEQVSTANTYFINSQLIQNKNTRLSVYANYRTVENVDYEDTESLNSRLQFNQKLFNNVAVFNAVYETVSGNLPQQEFTYVEVEPGQGFYAWNDYNGNGIQEIDEFEIAQFPDEAKYLRVALPTLNYLQTHQTKLSTSLNLNFQQWSNKTKFKKLLSHFQNQTYLLIDNKQERTTGSFNMNPFDINAENLLALNYNLKNSLFYNRGKQYFSTTYNYIKSQNKTNFAVDELEGNIQLHQLQFVHKFKDFWVVDLKTDISSNQNNSLNYATRNYDIETSSFHPKLSYLYNNSNSLDFFYSFKNKENTIGDLETLAMHNLGVSYRFSNQKKTSINTEFNYFSNDFMGNSNSPVAYQMLEGLQNGNNFTWSLLWLQKLTNFLDLNINYLGRKSETSKTIHSGTVQLRAHF